LSATSSAEGHPSGEFRGTDRFAIERRIGAGGMGVVYEAIDRERHERIALKTLRSLDAAAIYHLKQEFRALADVRHPNLVRLHELVSDAGSWFFTMELIDGVDFLRWVRGDGSSPVRDEATEPEELISSGADRSSPRQVPRVSGLRISPHLDLEKLRASLRQLVGGISALHAAGKLHRDVKPSNVVVTREGRVVLLDFGLATELQKQGTLQSIEQHILGTPEYMSPEQGAARPLGPSSDWYSVGVMLFEALTGGVPFVGAPLEILMAKDRGDAPAPGSLVEGIPEDLDRLCTELLRRDPSARPSGADILRRLGNAEVSPDAPEAAPMSVPPPKLRLVGRERELEALDRTFRRARQGRAVALHVHGPAGVGKSALLKQFLDSAAVKQQALVLSGACYERESVPYKALDSVIDALSRHLRRLGRLQIEALLPRDVHAIARLFPVLARIEAVAAAPGLVFESPDPSELRRRAFAALREMLARMADRRPLIVCIDDLQWGDLDSIALLADLLRPPYPPPMLLVCAYRDEDLEANPTLRALAAIEGGDERTQGPPMPAVMDLRASTTARRKRRAAAAEIHDLAVGPLGEKDSRKLAQEIAGGVAESVAAEAAGNPLLIVEYARFLTSEAARSRESGNGAPSFDEMVAARLRPLDDAARKLLEILAVAGRPTLPAIAARAAGIEDDRAPSHALRDGHLVRTARVDDHDALETWHDRIREAVVARLGKNELADAHLRLANAIEAANLDDPEALALHLRAAGAKWKASHYAALAARRAESALAFDRAAGLYQLAIELAPANAPELRSHRIARADALVNAGRAREGAKEYLAAAEGAESAVVIELHRRAAQHLLQSGHVDEGIAVFEGVLNAIDEKMASTPRRALASLFFRRMQLRLRGLDFVEHAESEVSPDDLVRIDTLWALATGFGLVDTIRGMDFGTRNLLASLRAGEPYRLARGFVAESVFVATGGGPSRERTDKLVKLARTLADRTQKPHADGLATSAEAFLHFHCGEWKRARELFRRAERTFRERCAGVAWELSNVRHFHLACLVNLGELRRLADRMPALLEEASRHGDLLALTTMRVGPGCLLWLVHDDPEGGRRDVEDAVQRWSHRGFLLQHWYELAALSQFDLYAGDANGAYQRMQEKWPALEKSFLLRMQRVRIDAWAQRARLALASARRNKDSAALADAERCANKIEAENMPWGGPFVSQTRAALAAVAGNDERAIAHLDRAMRGFEVADMRLHARAAQRRLGALVGGDKGRTMVIAADVWMNGEDIQDPSHLADVLCPGFT
jgi:serine/threonine protein kinase